MKLNRVFRIICLALVFIVSASALTVTAAPDRDWKKYPAVFQIDTTEDVYAVGDAHADPQRLGGVLKAAGLIEALPVAPNWDQIKWSAGDSVMVMTGDMIDKWNNSLGVIAMLRALQTDAASKGGRVIITMGNHEVEFLGDPTGSKTEEFAKELTTAGMNPRAVANCLGDIGQFLCNLPIAARVNGWFFSHAGNSKNMSIKELGDAIESGFAEDGFSAKILVGKNSILEARLNKKGPGGIPWFYDKDKNTDPQKLLKEYAKALGVKHIVQGHQPGKVKFQDGKKRNKADMFQRYGIIFLIDAGMSQGVSGTSSTGGAMRITGAGKNQKATVICANGKTLEVWSEANNQMIESIHCGQTAN